MYNVTAYYNTGYNAVNLPYSPATLAALSTKYTFPAIDIVQGKCSATIKAKIPTTIDPSTIDYLQIERTSGGEADTGFYAVTGYSKKAADVCEFRCVEDFITELGGIARLQFTDGIIVRESVAVNAWDEDIIDDELLGCSRPLKLYYTFVEDTYQPEQAETVQLVESTLDLSAAGIGYSRIDDAGSGGTSAQSSLIPTMQDASAVRSTRYRFYELSDVDSDSDDSTTSRLLSNVSGGQVFNYSETNVAARIADARSLGIENGILTQYEIPDRFVTTNLNNQILTIRGNCKVYRFSAPAVGEDDLLNFVPHYDGQTSGFDSPHEQTYYIRAFQGQNNRYGLYSCGGDKIEFIPEDIRKAAESYPVIYVVVDPRAKGKPYYQPRYYKGKGNPPLINSVEGAEWQKLPLRFTDVSGSEILTQQFKNTSRLEGRQHMGVQNQLENASAMARLNQSFGFIGGTANLVGGAVGSATKALMGGIPGIMQGVGEFASQPLQYLQQQMLAQSITNAAEMAETNSFGVYELQRAKELYDFGVTTMTVAPEVFFPADINLMREIYQNGCMIYRYTPDPIDIQRHNVILNAYGLKCFKHVDEISPSNGINFYYVQIQGAKVARGGYTGYNTGYSLRMAEGAAAQLAAGCRFWKRGAAYDAYKTYNVGTYEP